eukprot:m.135310 g.135310  ORF g.135310 m.135310 type:complete len:454 (-) comp16943_c0_seq3:43-1404(-)
MFSRRRTSTIAGDAPTQRKRAAKRERGDDTDATDSATSTASAAAPKRSRRGAKKTKPAKHLTKLPEGWKHENQTVATALFGDFKGSQRVCAFDVDGTLVKTGSGRMYPTNDMDWRWKHACIPEKLKSLHEEGRAIVFIANYKGMSNRSYTADTVCNRLGHIATALTEQGVPVLVIISTEDDLYRKPSTGMWDLFVQKYNDGLQPDLELSVYVGDAAGRPAGYGESKASHRDYSAKDRKFAYNVGLPFQTAEEFFLKEPTAPFEWRSWSPADTLDQAAKAKSHGVFTSSGSSGITSKKQELVVTVGPPASGATTFVNKHLAPAGYVVIDRHGRTPRAVIKDCKFALKNGHSVCIDATNPSREKRSELIAAAKAAGVPVRCFHFDTPIALARHLNSYRYRRSEGEIKKLPQVVFGVFQKHFEEPTVAEGFDEVCKIEFSPEFESKHERELFDKFG